MSVVGLLGGVCELYSDFCFENIVLDGCGLGEEAVC